MTYMTVGSEYGSDVELKDATKKDDSKDDSFSEGSELEKEQRKRTEEYVDELCERSETLTIPVIAGVLAMVFGGPIVGVGLANVVTMEAVSEGLWPNWYYFAFYFAACFQLFGLWVTGVFSTLGGMEPLSLVKYVVLIAIPSYLIPVGGFVVMSEAWTFPPPIGSFLLSPGPTMWILGVVGVVGWKSRTLSVRTAVICVGIMGAFFFLFASSVIATTLNSYLRRENVASGFRLLVSLGYVVFARVAVVATGNLSTKLGKSTRNDALYLFITLSAWYKALILSTLPEPGFFAAYLGLDVLLIFIDAGKFSPWGNCIRARVKGKKTRESADILMTAQGFVFRTMIQLYAPILYLVLYPIMYWGPNKNNFLIKDTPEDDVDRSLIYAAISFVVKLVCLVFCERYVSKQVAKNTAFTGSIFTFSMAGVEKALSFCLVSMTISVWLVTKYLLVHTNADVFKLSSDEF